MCRSQRFYVYRSDCLVFYSNKYLPVFISISVSISQHPLVVKARCLVKTQTTSVCTTNVQLAMFITWAVPLVQSGIRRKKLAYLWAKGSLVMVLVSIMHVFLPIVRNPPFWWSEEDFLPITYLSPYAVLGRVMKFHYSSRVE